MRSTNKKKNYNENLMEVVLEADFEFEKNS